MSRNKIMQFYYYVLGFAMATNIIASDLALVDAADCLLPDSKLTTKELTPHNLTVLRYRTNQPFPAIEKIIENTLGGDWRKVEVGALNVELSSELRAAGVDVISTAQYDSKACSFQHVVVRYINMQRKDGCAYTVLVNAGHCPKLATSPRSETE